MEETKLTLQTTAMAETPCRIPNQIPERKNNRITGACFI